MFEMDEGTENEEFTAGHVNEGFTADTMNEGFTAGPVNEGFTAGPVNEGFAADTVNEGFTAGPVNEGFTAGPVNEGFAAGPVNEGFAADTVIERVVADTVNEGFTAGPVNEGFTAGPVNEGFAAGPVNEGFAADTVIERVAADTVNEGFTTDTVDEGFTADKVKERCTAGTVNDGVTESERDEIADVREVKNTRRKVYRHNTDIVTSVTKRRIDDDVIIEEDSQELSDLPVSTRPARKKAVLVSRHSSDVLRKRLPDRCITPSSELEEVTITRRSVSRHGSQIQGSRAQVLDQPESTSNHQLKSDKQNKRKKAKRKLLTELALRKLREHTVSTTAIEGSNQKKLFVKARATLESNHIVLLTGMLGTGKSYTAKRLLEHIIRTYADFKPIFIDTLDDLEVLRDAQSPLAVVADDFLGAYGLTECNQYMWTQTVKHLVPLIENKRIYLILTAEKEQLEHLKQTDNAAILNTCDTNVHIDFDSEDLSMTSDDVETLLTYLLKDTKRQLPNTGIESHVDKQSNTLGKMLSCHLAAVSDVEAMMEDPTSHIEWVLSDIRTHSVHNYMLLLTMLIFGGRAPNTQLKDEEEELFRSIQTMTELNDTSYTELVSSGTQLIEKRFIVLDTEWGCFRFYHKVIHIAVCKQFIEEYGDRAIQLLPLDMISSLSEQKNSLLPEQEVQGENGATNMLSINQQHYRTIIERYQKEIQTSTTTTTTTEKFNVVASSPLWKHKTFSEIAFAFLGTDFFFTTDNSDTSMATHMIKTGQSEIVLKLAEYINNYKPDEIAKQQGSIRATLCEACRTCQLRVAMQLISLVTNIDTSIMKAAAEGGDPRILQLLTNQGGQIFQRKGDVVHTACRYGNVSAVEFVLDQTVGEHSNLSPINNASIVHAAATSNTTQVLQLLVQQGADVHIRTQDGLTLLHTASKYGRLKTVQYLLEKQPELLHKVDTTGFTAAHFAARDGHLNVLEYLIDKGVNVMLKVYKGNSILHLAAYNERVAVLKYLCHAFPDLVQVQNDESFTALQLSAKSGRIKSLQFFFQIGADILTETVDGRSLLHLSAFYGKLDAVKYFCTHYPQMISVIDNDGNTAAHDAAASGSVPVLRYLTDNLIDPLVVSAEGCTLLHDACFYGRLEVIKYICDKYPQLINKQSKNGYTPCHGAALGGFIEVLQHLIDNGANPNVLSQDGCTLLHEAAFSGQLGMVKFLCEKFPAMLTVKNKRSYAPCHFAVQEGHLEIAGFLLVQTNDEMSMTEENQTVLHIAAYNGHIDVVKYLSEQFPHLVPLEDVNAATAIHYAARGGHVDVLTYLMEYDFDPFSTTSNGSTMLHLAAYDGQYEMVVYLCDTYPHLITIVDHTKHNVAHYAAGSGNILLLLFTLEKGLDPMSLTENGSTLLLKTAYNGHIDTVKYLCSTYPEMLKISDMFGCNVAHYAACAGHIGVLTFVINEGINPLERTADGHSILHVAAFHGQLRMVAFLCQTYPELRHARDNSDQTPYLFAKLGGHSHIERYFRETTQVETTEGSGAVGISTLLCCVCRRQCCRRIGNCIRDAWKRIVSCMCTCRK